MIKFENVTKIYYTNKGEPINALSDVSFNIEQGEFVSLVGRSGAGKTTIVKHLIGQEKPAQGNIFFKGINVSKVRPGDLQKIRRKIGVVHQDYKLLFNKTVQENLSYIMQVIGVSDESIKLDVPIVLALVGLEQRAGNFPSELSGGEKQRLAIARALVHRPEVIVADEPTGNLDLYNTYDIINLFKKIHQLGTTIILSTHNKDIVNNLNKRVITLSNGRIISDQEKGKFKL